jgi:DNA-binding CsgD family transcriptional regulator
MVQLQEREMRYAWPEPVAPSGTTNGADRDDDGGPDSAVDALQSHALGLVQAIAPSDIAGFYIANGRLHASHATLWGAEAPADFGARYRDYLETVGASDPFAMKAVQRAGLTMLTTHDVGDRAEFAQSPIGRHLHAAGIAHVAGLYLWESGRIVACIVLHRRIGAEDYSPHEVAVLRKAQPLLQQAYALAKNQGGPMTGEPSLGVLTQRERQVAELLGEGRSNAEIAHALFISADTVKTHCRRIYAKVGVRSRAQFMRWLSQVR